MYCCSQCSFTAQFESALMMHHQLHHDPSNDFPELNTQNILLEKSNTVPRISSPKSPESVRKSKGFRLAGRTSSTTRLFNNLKARICRSKALFTHSEENNSCVNLHYPGSAPSGCTSKGIKVDSTVSSTLTACLDDKETFGCHLCSFEADRITVLDRHLLNDHKIGLENLLKLVMAKTKYGLLENTIPSFGARQPYYKLHEDLEEEFIIETVAPKIKIVKHASTNTEHPESNAEDFKAIAGEIEKLFKIKQDGVQDDGFMSKMATLNECMCKFVDSSNTLKKVLSKELDSKANLRDHLTGNEPFFNLGLGDKDSPRDWERAHSEKMERSRRHNENSRGEKEKRKLTTSGSFYF